jgi:hypothetical protein
MIQTVLPASVRAVLDWVNQPAGVTAERSNHNQRCLAEKGAKPTAPAITKTKDILFDVIVLTWNGKEEFELVLNALRTADGRSRKSTVIPVQPTDD